MHSKFPDSFVLPLLRALVSNCGGGVSLKNNAGLYALHYGMQRDGDLSFEIIKLLVDTYPDALLAVQTPIPATLPPPVAPTYTLPPPFIMYLMRNKFKVDLELCK